MNGGESSKEKMARNSAGSAVASRVIITTGMPLALNFLKESANAAQSLADAAPSLPSLDACISLRMMQQGRMNCARCAAAAHGFEYDDDDDGDGSVTDTVAIPAASAAANATMVFPQLVSHDFGFVMHTRTWHACDATASMLQPT